MKKRITILLLLFLGFSYSQSEKFISIDKDRNSALYDYFQNIDKEIASLKQKNKDLEKRIKALEDNTTTPPDTIIPPPYNPDTGFYGYGKNTVGGQGGRIIKVTSLEDPHEWITTSTGGYWKPIITPGTLRAAVVAAGERVVDFDVDGRINLKTSLHITDPFITIDGSENNITLSMEGYPNKFVLRISAPEVILSYITIRRSLTDVSSKNSDGVYIEKGYNIVLDHCSLSWASDELLGIADYTTDRNTKGTYNITVQNCLFGYTYGDKGILISGGAADITIYKNVFASTKTRVPAISTPTNQDYAYDANFEVVNNIFYDSSTGTTYQINKTNNEGVFRLNYINNLSFQNEGGGSSRNMMTIKTGNEVYAYLSGNEGVFRPDANEGDEFDVAQYLNGSTNINNPVPERMRLSEPVQTPLIIDNISFLLANQLIDVLLPTVGNSKPLRDEVDILSVQDVRNGTQSYNSSVNVFPY